MLSKSGPVCPAADTVVHPALANIGAPPSVATWKRLTGLPKECYLQIDRGADLVVAFASLFSHSGSINEIAKRIGGISLTRDVKYWSVTDQDWRALITEAYALNTDSTDGARTDFSANEVLSGRLLYFAQNDTRSWGVNTFSMQVVNSSANHLVLESRNVSPVRLGPITLFKPGDTMTVLFIDRMEDQTWRYYSLSVVQHSGLSVSTKSVINRQTAFYRLLIGQKTDGAPPLAR